MDGGYYKNQSEITRGKTTSKIFKTIKTARFRGQLLAIKRAFKIDLLYTQVPNDNIGNKMINY